MVLKLNTKIMDTKYYLITKENAIKAFVNYKETEYTKDKPLIYLYTGTCKFADLCFITTPNKIIYLTSKVYVDSDIELFELIETNRKELFSNISEL